MIKRTGFTLAEVLVTLLVIGVVAALTIPTLMGSTNDSQLKTAYKKAFSSLSNAMDLIKANETKCKIATSADLAACFKSSMKGTLKEDDNNQRNILVTSDGIAYKFYYNGTEKNSVAEACNNSVSAPTCAVVVDLNGLSKDSDSFALYDGSAITTGSNLLSGKDQQAMFIQSEQIISLPSDFGGDYNKGYEWLGLTKEDTTTSALEDGRAQQQSVTSSSTSSGSSSGSYSGSYSGS